MPASEVPDKVIRVLLVDDHAVVRSGLRMLIENRSRVKVIGEAANPTDALAVASQAHPDVIVLDLDLGTDSGLDLLPKLLSVASEARVLVLTGVRDFEKHRKAARLGAVGLVQKDNAVEVLLTAIEKVYAGEIWFDRALLSSLITETVRTDKKTDLELTKIATLTPREREIICVIADSGLKNKQIAERLFISPTTVRHHLTSIFQKLCVSDRLELAIYAYRYGIAKPPQIN
jgi:DNA-binding NarL/FixJ family response regulator